MDILPSDLATYGGAAKTILQDLQSRNERMFNLTFLVMHMAETKQKLEIAVSQAASVAQTYNCLLTRLDFQQEDGLMRQPPPGPQPYQNREKPSPLRRWRCSCPSSPRSCLWAGTPCTTA